MFIELGKIASFAFIYRFEIKLVISIIKYSCVIRRRYIFHHQ